MSFVTVLNISVSASWLVLAIVLLRPLLKHAPRGLLCSLWLLVAVRLLCPGLPESPVSLVPAPEVIPEVYLQMEPAENTEIQAEVNLITNPIYPEAVDLLVQTTVDQLQWRDLYWTLLWWFGMGIMGVYGFLSYLRLWRRTRISVRLEKNIWLCDDIDAPFILGVFRPRICLPSDLSPEQIRHVIAHEKTHLKRLDHWWKPFGFLLLTIHWFNPVMWLAYVLLCRDIELACDERVIRNMDRADVRAYSEVLISCSARQRFVTACPLAFGEVGVKTRIKSMLSYRKPGFWMLMAAVAAMVVLALCFLTNPPATTIGTFRESGFSLLFDHAQTLTFRSADAVGVVHDPETILAAIRDIPIDPNEISRSRREDRDRTYEIVNGNTMLCISEDFSQIWIDDQVKPSFTYKVQEPETLRAWFLAGLGDSGSQPVLGNYVPYQCLYISNLSSYYPFGGDSGAVYWLEEESFTVILRNGSVLVYDPMASDWQDIDWNTDFFRELAVVQNEYLDSPSLGNFLTDGKGQYRMLCSDQFLLWSGGRLMIVDTFNQPKTGRTLWSIYQLVPENQLGSASWEFMPAMSSRLPAFPFGFDPGCTYTHISASAAQGTLISFDEPSPVGYPSGQYLEIPAGKALYWAPMGEDGTSVREAKISFSILNGDHLVANGVLYITAEQGEDPMRTLYSAQLIGAGLRLEQNSETGGGRIVVAE